ncbi:MAG TPA: hypothetical protein VMT58_09610 [Candidatus Binataceae bacterium]|nr:hypothetical protein [Candidatus Binataceae bacterium]
MIVPPVAHRREIDRNLAAFFRTDRPAYFNRAISALCRYFNVRRPRIEWFEYLDWGKTAGKTYEDGRIHLVHPANWKRGRIYNSERKWIQMIYHEMGHFLFWTDAERKADLFSRRMVAGLRAVARRCGSRTESFRTAMARRRRGAPAVRRVRARAAASRKRRASSRIGAR